MTTSTASTATVNTDEVRHDLLAFPPDSYSAENREFIGAIDISETTNSGPTPVRPRLPIPKIVRGYLRLITNYFDLKKAGPR